MTVHEGDIFRFGDSMKKSRVVAVSADSAFLVPLTGARTCTPLRVGLWDLEQDIEDGEAVRVPEISNEKNFRDYSEAEIIKARGRWEKINGYWNSNDGRRKLLTKETRGLAFKELAEVLGVTEHRARVVMSDYWRGGMTSSALLPKTSLNRGESQGGGRRGRPPAAPGAYSGQVGERERKLFEKYYRRYQNGKERTLSKAYLSMIKENYTQTDETTGRSVIDPALAPSLDQFKYWVRKHKNPAQEARGRMSLSDYTNNRKMTYSTSAVDAIGPGSVFELDATRLNVELVSEGDRSLRVGTPLLHALVDLSTRMVVGYSLSLENESWLTAAMAILHTVSDKREYCASLGFEIEEEDWPAHHLPAIIMADNAKFTQSDILLFDSDKLRSQIKLGRPYIAKDKPAVERAHRKIKDFIRGELPGAIQKKISQRGERDPADEAALTLSELERIIALVVLIVNSSPIKDYPLSPQCGADGIPATPKDLWINAVEHSRDSLVVVDDIEFLRRSLLPSEKRVMRRFGVMVDGFKYSAPDPATREEIESLVGSSVKVTADPNDIDRVYLQLPERNLELTRQDPGDGFHGMTRKEAALVRRVQKEQEKANLAFVHARTFDYEDMIGEIVDDARRATGERVEIAKINKKKRENRKAEKEAIRKKERQEQPGEEPNASSSPSSPLPGEAEVLDFLNRMKGREE